MSTAAPLHLADIVIVGAGLVGAAFALALADSGRKVLLIDGEQPHARFNDPRSLALSHGSRLILERLGVWSAVAPISSIDSIHISQRGGFGRTLLTAAEARVPALGYVVSYASVQRALSAALERASYATVIGGATATDIEAHGTYVDVALRSDDMPLHARGALAVIADGGALAREVAAVDVREYAQSAVVANVSTTRAHQHRAYERFTPAGPIALLPREQDYAMVWTLPNDEAQRISALPRGAFLAELQAAFGERAGRFVDADEPVTFALSLRVAHATRTARTVLLGNAAQTLHPVAGQGLNIGLRDAWALAHCLREATADLGSADLIKSFERRRRSDRANAIFVTDALINLFSNDHLALRWLRGCGLTFLDCVPPAKRLFMSRMNFGPP